MATKNIQLTNPANDNLMPRTKTEVISIDIIHDNVYKGFVAGKCWLPAGLSTTSHFSAHTDLIEVKQGDVIIVENYRTYASATGGGPFCAIYPTNEGTGGTRYNCNDVLVPDPSVSLKYTFIVPQDGWIGINIGVETQSYITACRIIHQQVEEGNLKDKIDELDGGVKRIEDSLYKSVDGKQVDVIIFMGQSNMAGRGIVTDTHPEDAPAVLDGAGYEFRAITDPTKLYPITKTLGVDENVSGGINDTVPKTGGCVPAFVNAYFLATKTPVIAVSASEGNTRSSEWKAGTARLNDAISRLESCVAWLTANGYDIAHKYMVWCQGEADADAGVDAATYSANFANMFSEMQSHGIEKCFMIQIGEYNGTTSGLVEAYQLIQQAQVEICDTTPNVVMISDSFRLFKARGLMKDQFHYYQDGYNIVGLQAGHNAGLNRNISGDIVYDYIETNKVRLTTPLGEKIMPQTDAEVVDVVDTELSYTTLVNNKYINKNGVEVSQNGQTYGYGEIGDIKKVRVKWTSFANVQNYSLIAFYASDDFTLAPISKLVGVNGVTTGEAIVDVPEGAVYFAYSMPTNVTLTVYTSDALTYVKDMRKELMSLGLDYNHFDELELVERVASTYLSRGGAVVYGTSWSAYAIRVYAVVPGQVVYFYHPIAWNTGFAVYGFANSYASGTRCKAYEADISQSVTPKYDGSFKRLVVPDGCQYLIVNELAAVGEKAFTHIKVLGTPRHVDLHKVKNYNPCFDLSSPVWAQQVGDLDQWISGLGCSFSGAEQLKYPTVVEDSGSVFADTGATHYLECIQKMNVGPGCRFFYLYSKDFSNAFKKNKTLRVEFDLQIDSDAAIAIKFNSYCYLNGSTSGLGGTQYEQTFQPGVVTHVDRIFYYSNLPLENGFIQFNLVYFTAAQLSHITSVKIANLVITDDIQQLNIPTQEAYKPSDWLGRNRYFNKRCLFIGDSISTSGTWVWKNVLNWRYGLRSEDRKSSDMSIAPAEGSITIAASNKEGNSRSASYSSKMSIWYKCAYHRMDIYDFDVISLFGGTNDAWWDDTLYPGGVGTADDIPYVDDASTFADPSKYTDVYSDNLTFMQFYKGCVEMLMRDFPDKELILSTLFPLNSNYRLDYQIAEGKTCRRDEWVSYLILQVARKYNLKCNAWYWNMYPPAGWSGNVNIGAIIHHDGVHPSVVDGYMMADRFATALGC